MDSKEKEVICGTTTAIKGLSITLYRQAFFYAVRPLWLYITDARKTKKPAGNLVGFLCTKGREDVQMKMV
jgi:hypothetical protein